MTVSELFKKYDFDSVLPHLDHLFVVNSGRNLSSSQVENARSFYDYWAKCETKPTNCYIRLVSRWEHTSPSIDMNCHVREKNVFCYSVADQKDMIEVLSMKVRVDKYVEISDTGSGAMNFGVSLE